jgi:hypothetical protein
MKTALRLNIAVNHKTGDLFVSQWNVGVWMSPDRGATFARVDTTSGTAGGGGPYSSYGMVTDATGEKLAVFTCNAPSSEYSLDGGKTWTAFKRMGRGWDFGAVDWESRTILALRHENKSLDYSTDLGQSWTQLGPDRLDFCGVGIFSAEKLVLSGSTGIQLSTDAGKTWSKVSDYPCMGVMQVFQGVAYWVCNEQVGEQWNASIVTSDDQGKTWRQLGKPLEKTLFATGPCFGKDEKEILIATLTGIMESTDTGRTWSLLAPYPSGAPLPRYFKDSPGFARQGLAFPNLGFDYSRKILYVFLPDSKNWQQLWKYER